MGGHTKSFASKQMLLTATAQEIMSPSDRRYAVLIPPPIAGTAFIGVDSTITTGNGIAIPSNGQPLFLTRDTVGDLVRRGFWAVGLAAYGENARFTTGYLRSLNQGAGPLVATLVCPAGQYIEVDGWEYSANKNEIGTYTVADLTPANLMVAYCMESETVSLVKPLRGAAGQNVKITGQPTATSTDITVGIWGRTVLQPVGLSAAMNLTIIEIFDCDCPNIDAGALLEVIRRKL